MIDGRRFIWSCHPPTSAARNRWFVFLNPIGRRLTEELNAKTRRHRVLLMLDEFPALGRLDFFESALAYMAGYGLKSFLIAQSLNQIEKAYSANNAILDNCHVRVAFATNDERTAKRVSDALGTASEMRAMKNYAGYRLSPWLGHLMVSRQETARPLLTPEVMQLPPADELVLVSGVHPILAKKARYYEDRRLQERILPSPSLAALLSVAVDPKPATGGPSGDDPDNSGIRREPTLPEHEAIAPESPQLADPFAILVDETDDEPVQANMFRQAMRTVARQAALDPGDGLEL
jgi:type IV secretion system protein VirD4